MKKVLNIILDIFLVLFVMIAVVITISSINQDGNGVSRIFGYIPLNVQSGSMEPTIMTGDFIITKEVEFDDLKENDIISYLTKEEGQVIIVTHRIIEIEDRNGQKVLTTKGDNNDQADETKVTENNVISRYDGTRIAFLGKALSFLESQLGFFIFIILPLAALFIYLFYKFIVTIIDSKKNEILNSANKDNKDEEEKKEKPKSKKKKAE